MKAKRFFSVVIALMMLVSCFAISASADTTYTLNINLFQTNDSTEVALRDDVNLPDAASGREAVVDLVKFNVYKVASDTESTVVPTGATVFGTVETNRSGVATFTTTEPGRYLVVKDTAPQYASGTDAVVPFLVDLPRTNNEGTAKENIVNVYPKMLVTGAIRLEKLFNGNKPTNGEVAKFSVTGPNGYTKTINTDPSTGVVCLNGLDFGTYTFIETDVTAPFVVVDTPYIVTVNKAGYVTPTSKIGTVANLQVLNGSVTIPKVNKKVSDTDSNYRMSANINSFKDRVAYWRIAVRTPKDITEYKSFNVTDTIDPKLTPMETETTITGASTEAVTSNTINGRIVTVTFDPTKLQPNALIEIKFTTEIRTDDKVITTGERIYNSVNLNYRNASMTDKDDELTINNKGSKDPDPEPDPNGGAGGDNPNEDPYVWTGKIDVLKTGTDTNGAGLAGAIFKLLDDKGVEVATSTPTDDNGEYSFIGVLDGTYKLVETTAPSGYELNDAEKTVIVADGKVTTVDTKAASVVNVVNIPKTKLPLTGGMGVGMFAMLGLALASIGSVAVFKTRKSN